MLAKSLDSTVPAAMPVTKVQELTFMIKNPFYGTRAGKSSLLGYLSWI